MEASRSLGFDDIRFERPDLRLLDEQNDELDENVNSSLHEEWQSEAEELLDTNSDPANFDDADADQIKKQNLDYTPGTGGPTDALTLFRAEARKFPLLTAQEEIDLSKNIQNGDKASHEKLVNSNLRLVDSIAAKYEGIGGMPRIDLIQEGCLGLIAAADKYDWQREVRFSTYAVPSIRRSMIEALRANNHLVSMNGSEKKDYYQIKVAERELAGSQKAPTDAEIQQATGLSANRVQALREAGKLAVSLHTPLGEDGDSTLLDVQTTGKDETGDEASVSMTEQNKIGLLSDALEKLDERTRQIIMLRFGLSEYGETDILTLDEVSRMTGVSPERVRQIEGLGLHKLRSIADNNSLRAASIDEENFEPVVKIIKGHRMRRPKNTGQF